MRPVWGCPIQSAHSDQGERKAEGQQRGSGFAPESNSQERATVLLTRLCPEPRKSVYLSTSCQRSKFGFAAQSLRGEQRLHKPRFAISCLGRGLLTLRASLSSALTGARCLERPPLGCVVD